MAWALGAILFRRLGDTLAPPAMNLTKCLMGMLYLGIPLLCLGLEPLGRRDLLLLGASGLLGIALGDSFFFHALMRLGPRLTVLAEMLGPVLTVLSAIVFLHERLNAAASWGIALTLAGVAWVLWEHAGRRETRSVTLRGLGFSLLSGACMSAGIILAKMAIVKCSALEATFLRLAWAAGALSLWGCATRRLGPWLKPLSDPRAARQAAAAAAVAIYGGFWLFLVALKRIDAAVATALNATTPLFILPLAAGLLKERLSPRAVFGAVVAVAGVALLVFSS